ncbi:E3 ubiquitin ligase PQT3-like isoform X2 [Rutidosis leptorrhynchoides]|uniref:E3 ubiquitin ligase PQT3-like isoform X2 n=1 Tax=Rutidosis leptorrhynchoides TaxID=125765 RepID=UPI003A9954D1
MAVNYKFRSEKGFRSLSIEGHYITVGQLKNKIFYGKPYRKGKEDIIVLYNAQTNEEYLSEAELIPRFTSVVVRRGSKYHRIASPPKEEEVEENKSEIDSMTSSVNNFDFFDFGKDVYDIPEVAPNKPVISKSKAAEDSKLQAYELKYSGRGGFERPKPPVGYVCHRCNIPGHLIQHCPTNGDANFDIKRYQPNAAATVFKLNFPAIEKELEGIPSSSTVIVLPPEFHCPLCKQAMKDAVFASKCCFQSFCDKCIRDKIISEKACFCGATDRLADDLLPNYTLRDTITRMLEADSSSSGSLGQGKDYALPIASKRSQSPSHNVEANKLPSGEKEEISSMLDQKVSVITKEPALQGCPQPIDNEVQNKKVTVETPKKKKNKKMANSPVNGDPGPFLYNPYWNGYMNPYYGFVPQLTHYGIPGMMHHQIPLHRMESSEDKKFQREVSDSGDVNTMKSAHIPTSHSDKTRKRQRSLYQDDSIYWNQASVVGTVCPSTPRTAFCRTKNGENESSDDEVKHFKRKRSWYDQSSSPMNDYLKSCQIPMES